VTGLGVDYDARLADCHGGAVSGRCPNATTPVRAVGGNDRPIAVGLGARRGEVEASIGQTSISMRAAS
jgi:hypothetical protein